jgi:hypothetical protein
MKKFTTLIGVRRCFEYLLLGDNYDFFTKNKELLLLKGLTMTTANGLEVLEFGKSCPFQLSLPKIIRKIYRFSDKSFDVNFIPMKWDKMYAWTIFS